MLDDSLFQLDEEGKFFNISHSNSYSPFELVNTDDFSSTTKDNSFNEKTTFNTSIQVRNDDIIHHLSENNGSNGSNITKTSNRKDSTSRILIIILYDYIIDQLNKDYTIFCKLNLNKDYRFSYFNNEKMKKKTISQREFSRIMSLSLKDVISNRKFYKTDESYDIEMNKVDKVYNKSNSLKYTMSLMVEDRLNTRLNKTIYDHINDLINDDHFLSKVNSYFIHNIQEIIKYLLKKNVILYENLCFDKVKSYKDHINNVNNMFHSQCFY